jgi:hypothetical protein
MTGTSGVSSPKQQQSSSFTRRDFASERKAAILSLTPWAT